jgi:hypothetical protein
MSNLTQQQFSALLERYVAQDLSGEELQRFLDAVPDPQFRPQLEAAIGEHLDNAAVRGLAGREPEERVWASLLENMNKANATEVAQPQSAKVRRIPVFRWAAAAVIFIILAGGVWWLTRNTKSAQEIAGVTHEVHAPR